ncbi:M14 family metallopeptidase [Formosa sp. PL04]|uniref:M14 family metallopeptidase n=1 Tax=Formosa sp. PL04 TaxID=3081755 RepID=UPI002982B41A|nr:M14 family metallopeptidase [Formosa sp. PL04]MDW5287715.1 M14 family metallopeptidase [Formosa sp. PL04]
MKYFTYAFIILLLTNALHAQIQNNFITPFEQSGGLETATYDEVIQYYIALAKIYPQISIQTMGKTDSGKPLHIVTLDPNKTFNFTEIRKNKCILLINNGIHPGESDGIDATMMLFRDYVQGKIKMPKHTVLVTIPIYNIGGSLNRNSTTRTNQNGPELYGFRGNARNFDLNRDFIKSDTKNAKAFAEIFHSVQPDVFIDNHVSNGADYQYTLTHLFTQHNKLGGNLGDYLHTKMMPELEQNLASKSWDITPYVNVFNEVPEIGFSQFLDNPRYSTGYTTLFNTLGMMVETHMLKPYKPRVEGTYELMVSMIELIDKDYKTIKTLRNEANATFLNARTYNLNWEVDTTNFSILQFKGFEGEYITSEVTGLNRLKYDRSKPFTKTIKYQNYFNPTLEITIPKAYIIPQGWYSVIELLKLNQVKMTQLKTDKTFTVETYHITNFDTKQEPYEGHYLHSNTSVSTTIEQIQFRTGDYYIETHQPSIRYLLETLEPQAVDSFFNWNFFDTILQQKEGFSPYVWEDLALELLNNDAELKVQFETKKQNDNDFASNWYAQLDWLHKQSENYEKAHLKYPIYRVN